MLYVYKDRPSAGAVVLKVATRAKWLKPNSPPGVTVINWGCSEGPIWNHPSWVWLNHPFHIKQHTNKLEFFKKYQFLVRVPAWNVTGEREGKVTLVARKVLTGHSGNGIIICRPDDEVPEAPLYTAYIPKTQEYRVHFLNGKVIDVQRKIRDPNQTPIDWSVRSHQNGFIYVRNGVALPPDAQDQVAKFLEATTLSFGALDLIIGKNDGLAYVLEVNTAPGLEGQTLEKYREAFSSL